MDESDDRETLELHAAELARFYHANAPWLFGHAYLRVQQDRELAAARELAEDLVQDAFEAATRDWGTLRGLAPVQQRAWLRKTLSHKEVDQFRRRVVFRRKRAELHRRYQPAEPDPEQQALSAAALERTVKIIENLPAEQRRIARMKWNDHMTEAEIAAGLGRTKAAITGQVHLIRRKLIEGLGPYYPFAGDDGEGETS